MELHIQQIKINTLAVFVKLIHSLFEKLCKLKFAFVRFAFSRVQQRTAYTSLTLFYSKFVLFIYSVEKQHGTETRIAKASLWLFFFSQFFFD